MRLPSLTRAKTLAEYSSAGYLIFAGASLAALALFDARARALPGLQTSYSAVHEWFVAILRIVRLDGLPIHHAPLTVIGTLLLIALSPIEKLRRPIGELAADLALAVLSAMIFASEKLVRHRSLSSLLLIALTSLFAWGLWILISARSDLNNADATFSEWLDNVEETVRDTTLSSIDSHRYESSHKRLAAISHLVASADRLAAGNELMKIVDDLYGAVRGHSMCADLDHKLGIHEAALQPATDLGDSLLSQAGQLQHLLLARGYITLVDQDCTGDHESSLIKANNLLSDVSLESLAAPKDNIVNVIYSYAWLLWLPKSPAPGGAAATLCTSLDQCIWKAHSRYTANAIDDCTYSELRRRNNLANFLATVAAKDLPGTQPSSMNKWLRRRDTFAAELQSSLANLERCQDLARLGGHIAFLTLAQGYAALSTLAADTAELYTARSAGYFQLPAAMDPDKAFTDPDDVLFCKLWSSGDSLAVFEKELRQPADRRTDLRKARQELCNIDGH